MTGKPKPTRTTNPLHFEDLDPHRFEDLTRQLVYDFRNWASLEPTGRLGADEGYDARGVELADMGFPSDNERDEGEGPVETEHEEKVWQIQCKRERSIPPSKIAAYIEKMIPEGAEVPYGVIFSAPTDFSKKTRDVFRDSLRRRAFGNKADIEDALYQPKNDHLLYAYFGISLQIQKRSQRSALRSVLAIKRKAIKHLGDIRRRSFGEILIRDIDDNHYPYSKGLPSFRQNPPWKKFYFVGHEHDGIKVLVRRYLAYRDVEFGPPKREPKLKAWDFAKQGETRPNDIWSEDDDRSGHYAVYRFWQNLDQQKQAHFEIVGIIRYENIIEIDGDGDIYAQCPHVYVKRVNGHSLKASPTNSRREMVGVQTFTYPETQRSCV